MPDFEKPLRPGRSCPLHYRYAPEVFARTADIHADTLYVAGGVYGNRPALAALLETVDAESGGAKLVFNGDFNWFDVADEAFVAVNETALAHTALRGNVETEIASDDGSAGCGCGWGGACGTRVSIWRETMAENSSANCSRRCPSRDESAENLL